MPGGTNAVLTAFGASFLLGLLLAPWVRGSRGPRRGVLVVAACLLFALPLLVPESRPFGRCVMVAVACAVAAKLVDHARSPRRGLADFALLLADPFSLTHATRTRLMPAGSWGGTDLFRLSAGAAVATLGVMAFRWIGEQGFGFLAEHLLKAPVAWICIDATAQALHGLTRLFGFHATLLSDLAMLSRSPAGWWRRYNRMTGGWLARHVYRPLAGEGRYGRAVMATFLVSGLAHEYMFSIVFGRFDGYQLAFFLLQGAGVWFSGVMALRFPRPGRVARVAGWALHVSFMLATVVLMTASVDRVALPWFYRAEVLLPW